MKLDERKRSIVKSTNFEEAQFSIGNEGRILEIVRDKMYSNVRRVLIQEIASNGRDAQRELGNADKPIEITLPSEFKLELKIRDFGVGITPDRMLDVFIKYGCSTKNVDNVQTGGFGIGAKVPFAYSDSFVISTNTPEDEFEDPDTGDIHRDVMVNRRYVAYLGEKGSGTLAMIGEAITDDPQGTLIQIPVKEGDVRIFENYTRTLFSNWSVRPKIVGRPDFNWNEEKTIFSGQGWRIIETEGYSQSSHASILVDEIPYQLNWDALELDYHSDLYTFRNIGLRAHFNTGEVDISANREELDYSNKTVKAIRDKLNFCRDELIQYFEDSIKDAENLYEAMQKYCNLRKNYNSFTKVINKMEWKGILLSALFNSNLYRDAITTQQDSKNGVNFNIWVTRKEAGSLRRKKTTVLDFSADNLILTSTDDSIRPNIYRLRTVFEKNPDTKAVYVINYGNNDSSIQNNTKKYLEKKIHFSKMGFGDLSSYKKTIPSRGKKTKDKQEKKHKVTKIERMRNLALQETEAEETTQDGTGYYVYSYYSKFYLTEEDAENRMVPRQINKESIVKLQDRYNIKIRIIHKRYSEKIGSGWTPLKDLIEQELDNLKQDPEILLYGSRCGSGYGYSQIGYCLDRACACLHNILNDSIYYKILLDDFGFSEDHFVIKYHELSKNVANSYRGNKSLKTKQNNFEQLRRWIGGEHIEPSCQKELIKYREEFKERYPLLTTIASYCGSIEFVREIAEYIQRKDEQREESEKVEEVQKSETVQV